MPNQRDAGCEIPIAVANKIAIRINPTNNHSAPRGEMRPAARGRSRLIGMQAVALDVHPIVEQIGRARKRAKTAESQQHVQRIIEQNGLGARKRPAKMKPPKSSAFLAHWRVRTALEISRIHFIGSEGSRTLRI